jgi:hypothetical protein
MRRRVWRIVALVAGAGVALSIVAFIFDAGPLHAARCLVDGRDGWNVEYPQDATTADETKEVIPSCVSVHIGYVDWNEVEEGDLAIVPSARDWFGYGDSITLWVEGTSAQATDPCRPPAPSVAPPADCPGGPQRAP